MRIAALFAFIVCASGAHAAVLTWPGPAPCDGTLASCIGAAGSSDTVRIATNTVDNGVSILNKSLTLEAAPGFLPRFAEDEIVLINFTDGGNYSVTIRGLLFARGQIQAYHDSGDGTVLIERNRFEASKNEEPSIWLTAASGVAGADFDYVVRYNHVYDSTPRTFGSIRVSAHSGGNGWVRGEIVGNTIRARGDNARGIAVYEHQGSPHITEIHGNTIEGAEGRGIDVYQSSDGGTMSVAIYSNLVFDSPMTASPGEGIALWSFGDPITSHVVNNTVIHRDYGLLFRVGSSGALSATVANNLVADNDVAWLVADAATITEHHNLFDNSENPDSIDASSIIADPLLNPTRPGRLRAGSPAIDAGDNPATGGFPSLDARGNRRYIGATVDIGAFEYGDQWLLVRDPDGDNNNFAIEDPLLNGQPDLIPQITSVWNPHGPGIGVYNDGNEGLYYSSSRWRVFNESLGDSILQNASFAIFNPGNGLQIGLHDNASAASTTTIDWPATNDHPENILAVSQHWNRDDPGVRNDHPIGILYFSGKWRIANLDGFDIPVDADFNLYTQAPSQNAFEHIASGANRSGNWTVIHHPLLDDNPCARMQVTQSASQGEYNPHPIGVFYTGSNWAIFNQDLATMPENAAFHVIVDGNTPDCLTFSDRFQG